MLCNGQTLAIQQYTALFSIIGTYYGGNGTTTFQLPNLQGRAIKGPGSAPGLSTYVIGEVGGLESVTLQQTQMPIHTHAVNAQSAGGNAVSPANAVPAQDGSGKTAIPMYTTGAVSAPVTMAPTMIGTAGSSLPTPVLDPYLCVTYIIAIEGTFPSRN